MRNGIKGIVYRAYSYCGYGLTLIKTEGEKQFKIDPESIKWIESSPHSAIEPLMLYEFEDGRAEGEKGNLYGENLALKEEIKFLREQLAKQLDKV